MCVEAHLAVPADALCVDAMDAAARPIPVEPASPTKVKSAPPSDEVEPPATPSKAELPACASLVAKYAQLEAEARTSFAAAKRNFAVELRIWDHNQGCRD